MKKLLVICTFATALISQNTFAQEVTINPVDEARKEYPKNHIYNSLEKMPEYPGGINKFREFVMNNFIFSDELTENIRFVVTFIVEKDGSLSKIELSNNPGFGIAEEIQRIFAISQKWTPGYNKGEPVRTLYRFPMTIQFE